MQKAHVVYQSAPLNFGSAAANFFPDRAGTPPMGAPLNSPLPTLPFCPTEQVRGSRKSIPASHALKNSPVEKWRRDFPLKNYTAKSHSTALLPMQVYCFEWLKIPFPCDRGHFSSPCGNVILVVDKFI